MYTVYTYVKYHGKTHLTINICFKKKTRQEGETCPTQAGVGTSGSGKGKQNGWGEGIWLIYFIYMYENRTMKPVEIVLREERDEKE
jgi:hypothetical protein